MVSTTHKQIRLVQLSIIYGMCLVVGSMLIPTPATESGPTNPLGVSQHTSMNDTAEYSGLEPSTLEAPAKTEASQSNEFINTSPESYTKQISAANPYQEIVTEKNIVLGAKTYPLREYSISSTPNDPSSGQWWETAIQAPSGWDISTGSDETMLAIIDTGFALQHEEFTSRWFVNQGESGVTTVEQASLLNCSDQGIALDMSCNLIDDNFDGVVDNESGATIYENDSQLNCTDTGISLDKSCNLIDDDSNGLADDVTGWDYINYDRSVQAGETDPNGSGTRHGTYVASVAAGNSNNGAGIAGVNWNTTILPIQAIDDDGYGNSISVARAINYAVAQGADVISMSLGGAYPDSYLRLSLQNALRQGVVIAAASGNDGCNCISYPANYPEIIAVGALDYSLQRASFSSYGNNLDITAPGVGMYTASWTPSNGTNAYASGIAGTSLATPLVGGALATLKAQQPNATPLQLTAALLESADKNLLGPTIDHSAELGFGQLNIHSASERLQTAFIPEMSYNFSGLYSDANTDTDNVYQCPDGIRGASGIYALQKQSSVVVSSSLTQVYELQNAGYDKTLLTYGCVLQPHDTPIEKRSINTALELMNIFIK